MKLHRHVAPLGLVACVVLHAAVSRGDADTDASAGGEPRVDKVTCLDAVAKGQRLRDTHKLVEARDKFKVCARAECPSVVQRDCATWLAELDTAVPTVVLSAKDRGRDKVDVTVSVDGQPLASSLDGQAVAVDPGLRTFRFEAADGRARTTQFLVKEGVKAQSVSVVLSAAPGSAGSPALERGTGRDDELVSQPGTVPLTSRPSTTVPLVGLLIGGSGLIAVGIGTGVALDAKNRDNAAATEPGLARQTDSAGAVTEGNIATVVIGVGAAFAVAGTVLWFLAPSSHGSATLRGPLGTGVAVAPGRGFVLSGSF